MLLKFKQALVTELLFASVVALLPVNPNALAAPCPVPKICFSG
jgi:hypothetical protein